MERPIGSERLTRMDVATLVVYALLLFGVSLVSGRVLSLHEARLPQSSREMLADGDLLFPKSGGRPWLERPPLPHWIVGAVGFCTGGIDAPWTARLPSVLMGIAAAVLAAQAAAAFYGRATGLASGLILASSFQFLRYAWAAEEDVYVAAFVTLLYAWFAAIEFSGEGSETQWKGFFSGRRAAVLGFFLLLGASNLVKGLCFAAMLTTVGCAGWLISSRPARAWSRYATLWGWLLFAVAAAAWPLVAAWRHPEVFQVMFGDVQDRLRANPDRDPIWYYFVSLSWAILPWTPAAIAGAWVASKSAWADRQSPDRFVLCWAFLPMLLLSLPAWKHHHYLVPLLPAWAILSARGLPVLWAAVQKAPSWARHPAVTGMTTAVLASVAANWAMKRWAGRVDNLELLAGLGIVGGSVAAYGLHAALLSTNPRRAFGVVCGGMLVAGWTGHCTAAWAVDSYREETEFLVDVRENVAPSEPVYCLNSSEVLECFRILFYLDGRGKMLHNDSFLRDSAIREKEILVLARGVEAPTLRKYGQVVQLKQSPRKLRGKADDYGWTLFRLTFAPDLARIPAADFPIDPAQAYGLKDGPHLTPAETRMAEAGTNSTEKKAVQR